MAARLETTVPCGNAAGNGCEVVDRHDGWKMAGWLRSLGRLFNLQEVL
ncbi:MAG: hypothetical protein R8J84_01175 [Mariprofundales bacterium]